MLNIFLNIGQNIMKPIRYFLKNWKLTTNFQSKF
jgi:hypothetical protein